MTFKYSSIIKKKICIIFNTVFRVNIYKTSQYKCCYIFKRIFTALDLSKRTTIGSQKTSEFDATTLSIANGMNTESTSFIIIPLVCNRAICKIYVYIKSVQNNFQLFYLLLKCWIIYTCKYIYINSSVLCLHLRGKM